MRQATSIVVLVTLLSVSQAQQSSTTVVPNLINYSGTLHLPSSAELPAKVVGVTFAIYRQEDGGAPLWMETQNVTLDSTGHYTVLLGSTKSGGVPADLFNTQEPRWLGVQMEGEAEQPRVLLVSVPYAMKAGDAETVGGLPASAFALRPSSSGSGNESVNTGSVVPSGLAGQVTGSGTPNYIPVWTSTTNLGNSTIYQSGANVGIGTTSPTSMLSVAGSLSGNSVNTVTTYQISGSNVLSVRGTQNLFLGLQAGQKNTTGSGNVFSGYGAGSSNTTGVGNAFFGSQAGQTNTSGKNNTFLGWASGNSSVTGTDNTYVGYTSGQHATGSNNIYLGEINSTLSESNTIRIGTNQTAAYITGVINGNGAGLSGVLPAAGSQNYIQNGTAQQLNSGFNVSGNGTVGGTLSAYNVNAVEAYEIGGSNVLTIGVALDDNLFVGHSAGANNIAGKGFANTFTGAFAGTSNTTGKTNTFVGDGAGENNTIGSGNTFTGYIAGQSNTTGDNNTFTGIYAG